MVDVFIILSNYLFLAYIAVFILNSVGISINRDDENKVGYKLATQRICIYLFHINASVVLIMTGSDMTKSIVYCALVLFMLVLSSTLLKIIYKGASHLMYNCVFFLTDIGLVMLYRLNTEIAWRQIIFVAIGMVLLLLIPVILKNSPRIDRFSVLYVILSLGLISATLILGRSEFGSKNWLKIGSFSFQPSEIVKLFYITYISGTLAKRSSFKSLLAPTVITAMIVLLLIVQRDLGSAVIFFMAYMVVVYIATNNAVYPLLGLGLLGLGFSVAVKIFSHIRVRVEAWINPWADISGGGYQVAQSLFAITTWGITGIGLSRGYCLKIPVVERDFIFAAICEEFGVLFSIGLLIVYITVFLEGARGAMQSKSRFLSLLCAGLTAMLAFQTFVIVGGVIKLIPLTGVTLPFISYGGTSVVVCYIFIGMIEWIFTHTHNRLEAEAIELELEEEAESEPPKRRRRP